MKEDRAFGGIEAGGTKFVCAVGTGPDDLREVARFPTRGPEETLAEVVRFFEPYRAEGVLLALGVACFGPLDLDPRSPTYGHITATPKADWAGTDVAGYLSGALGLPVAIDTDVNGAALAEHRWGAAQGLDTFVYLTVGTGIGGSGMVDGHLVHGPGHPEMGHMRIPHDWKRDPFPGCCPFHGDCLEGLASGPAIEARWGAPPQSLPPGHPAWELEAEYLALGLVNLILVLSPQRVVIGGGVMEQQHLWQPLRRKTQALLGGYLTSPALNRIDRYIVPPALGSRAGVLGAIALARDTMTRPGLR